MKTKIALAIAALGSVTFVNAQTASLQDVVVVAKPILEEQRLDGQSTTSSVVGEEQLKDLNAADLASALRRTPGVSIARYNPVGAFGGDQGGAVFIRGMGASRPGSEIKTYIDGVPFYMPVWNHPLLDMLPMNGMSSVTVNKSPQPHITGNNFASIQLETKRPVQEAVTGNVRASVGKFNTTLEQADIAGKSDGLEYSFAQGYAKSNGHRPNADGQLNNAMGRIASKLNSNWTAGVSFLAVDTKAGDPGDSSPARYNIHANSVSAFVQHQHSDVNGEFRVYKNSGKSEWLNYTAPWGATNQNSQYDFEMSGVRWKESIKLAPDTRVIAGLDYDTMRGTPTEGSPTFKITSPYGSVVRTSALNADWSLVSSATLRAYQHSYYASSTSPALGFSLVSNAVTYYINASKGINYAGLDGPALDVAAGRDASWKTLKTEKADHVEVGAKFTPSDKTQVDVSVFKDKVSDRYYNTGMGGAFFSTGAFSNQGGEVTLRQQLAANWSAFVGATFLDPSISNLPYAPKSSYTVGVNGKAGPFKLAVDAQNQSDFYAKNWDRTDGGSSASNNVKLAGFTVVNARVAYPSAALGKRGEYFVAIENLTNTSYAYTSGRTMPGRWAQVGLVASFN